MRVTSVEEQAAYWREEIDSWSDERLVRWLDGIARLRLDRARPVTSDPPVGNE